MTIKEHFKKILSENQIIVVLVALLLGIFFPEVFRPLNRFSTELLILVFFTSSLRLSVHELMTDARDWKMLLLANVYMLIILPIALFLPFFPFVREWAMALLILGAMPTGMTIALVADFFGGRTSLALLVTATTSLLAPFTIPLIFQLVVGRSVPIPILQMFWSLFLTIVIPFFLAVIVKRRAPRLVTKHGHFFRHVSVIAFGILILGIVADTSGTAFALPSLIDGIVLGAFVLWMGFLTWFAYRLVSWRSPSERITLALCMVYLNNTLALFIGDRFFHDQNVVSKLVLLLLVINVLLPPLKWAASHLSGKIHPSNPNPFT